MEQSQQPSRRLLFVGLGAAIGLILVISLLAFVLFNSTKQESGKESTGNTTNTKHTVTKENVKKNLEDLNSSLLQAKTTQDAAKAALDDKNTMKAGS